MGQAAEGFGAPRGLARSTVLTMMERLRQKGHLVRRQVEGVYHTPRRRALGQVMRGVVRTFVEKTLGGSVSPFVTYLTEEASVSDEELAELRAGGEAAVAAEGGAMTFESVVAALLRSSLQGALFIGAVWLACRLFPRLPAAVRCGLWWAACLKLLVGLVWIAAGGGAAVPWTRLAVARRRIVRAPSPPAPPARSHTLTPLPLSR